MTCKKLAFSEHPTHKTQQCKTHKKQQIPHIYPSKSSLHYHMPIKLTMKDEDIQLPWKGLSEAKWARLLLHGKVYVEKFSCFTPDHYTEQMSK